MPTYAPFRLLLADDHLLFNDGLCGMLSTEADLAVVGQVYDGAAVLPAVQQHRPDLLLLDVNMPRQTGHELAPLLLRDYPNLKIIILTMYAERRLVDTFRQMGVAGYVLKNASRTALLEAIRTVVDGGQYFDPSLGETQVPQRHADDDFLKQFQLTPRELAIIRLIDTGLGSKEIADQMGLSYLTVKTHRRNIHYKLNTNSTAELIRFIRERGI